MDYRELLEYLDIEDPSEFVYFETLADLLECEEYIEPEAYYQLLKDVDKDVAAAITEEYFEDILEGLPEDSGEIYSLLHQIKLCIAGMFTNAEDEDDIRKLSDEVYRFRNWFCEESDVELKSEDTDEVLRQCLRDAITTSRMEKLGGSRYRYDFTDALDYELSDYVVSFSELMATEDYEDSYDNSSKYMN